jgi:hypothetical protein
VVGIATLVTFLPTITHILGDPETRDRLFARIKQIFSR